MIKKQKFKHVNGVFTDIVGTNKELSEFERFLNDGPTKMSPVLSKMTGTYKNIVTRWKTQFDTVSLLEETILQLRAMENISEIKLSIVRGDYIYARSPFYRRGGSTKDIRVIVGRTKKEGDDLNLLQKDLQFMESAKKQIQVAMDKVIAENRNELTKLLK
jgi:hypothetical protein